MERTLVIGDIHGAHKALVQVLELACISKNDRLIFLGDYVDGWSQSAMVIDLLVQLADTNPCVFVMGNHDVWCRNWLRTNYIDPAWIRTGGMTTVNSYENYTTSEKLRHTQFFSEAKYFFVDSINRLFIHAGFTSSLGPITSENIEIINWDRTLLETALAMDKSLETTHVFYPKRLRLYKEIFIGHTPTTKYNTDLPINAANLWNIDTGAGVTGKLTIMDVDTKQYWQSDTVQALYPNEKGRNK